MITISVNYFSIMQPPPKNWPRIAPALFYDDAGKAIDWLCEAFGFEVRLRIEGEGGHIEHSELDFGEGMIMVGDTRVRARRENGVNARSPQSLPDRANTQSLCIAVPDVDAHFEHAKKSGAKVISEPKTEDYGDDYWADRTYEVEDLEGHRWWFMTRVREQGQ